MTTGGHNKFGWSVCVAGGLAIGAIALSTDPIHAQVSPLIPDATLGAESSTVGANQIINGIPSNTINGGALRGINLFHSFLEFNIDAGRGVYFTNPAGVTNILSRVTGANPSTILGRLGVLGTANLYLINPNGIIFGANASLDVQGSFLASTASGIQLGPTGIYSATAPQTSTLISVQPGAFFLNALATSIDNQGNLQAGQNLSLVSNSVTNGGVLQAGQNLNLQGNSVLSTGQLVAPNGQISVTATAGNAQVQSLTAQTAILSASNDLQLLSSQITTSGDASFLAQNQVQLADSVAAAANFNVGGNLAIQGVQGVAINALSNPASQIQAGQSLAIASTSGSISAQGIFASGGDTSLTAGANLTVSQSQFNANNLSLISQGSLSLQDGVGFPFQTALGGNLLVQGTQGVNIQLRNNPASTLQTPGSLTIASTGPIVTSAILQSTGTTTFSAGAGLSLNNSVVTSTASDISLSTVGNLSLNQDQLTAAGNLAIATQGVVTIQDGVLPFDARAGAALTIQGNQGITIQTTNPASLLQSGGNLSLVSRNGAVATTIPVNAAGTYSIQSGGDITFGNYTGPLLSLVTTNGNITAGTIDTSSAIASGGAVTLSASGNVTVNSILAASTALVPTPGNGGPVTIAAGGTITTTSIDTTSSAGNGGPVSLQAGGSIQSGTIFTFANGNGVGGSVTLTANQTIVTGGIDTTSLNGDGGTINLLSNLGAIDTSAGSLLSFSDGGNGGSVTLTANQPIVTGGIDTTSLTGNGGAINLLSNLGAIDTSAGTLSSFSDGGNGGLVTLRSAQSLTVGSIFSGGGTLGNGGAINLTSDRGTVSLTPNQTLSTSSLGSGTSGNLAIAGQTIVLGAGAALDTSNPATGSAGSITLQATNAITSAGNTTNSVVLTTFASGPSSNSGTINLTAGSLSLTNTTLDSSISSGIGTAGNVALVATSGDITTTSSKIDASNFGTGGAGNVQLTAANGAISSTDLSIYTNTYGTGVAGDVNLLARSVSLINSGIDPAAFGSGSNGNISVVATEGGNVLLSSGVFYGDTFPNNVDTAGGNISIQGGNVTLNNFQLEAPIRGSDNGTSISINATNQVALENGSIIRTSVDQGASGQGGSITILGGGISLTGGSVIDANTASQFASGKGGKVLLSTPGTLSLQSGSRVSTTVEQDGVASGGNLTLQGGTVALDGAVIDASTRGTGTGGSIDIKATESVTASGSNGSTQSGLFAQSTSGGQAGDLTISTPLLTVQNGAEVSVTTTGSGTGGRLSIGVNQLQVNNGAEISASTEGSGTGGVLTINANQSVVLDSSGRLSARSSGSGNAGSLAIATDQLLVQNNAQASVSSSGTGNAGNLDVTARAITLTNGGRLTADTVSGAGGNIQVTARQDLNIANGAEISTSSSGSGNAGKINATATSLFLNSGGRITSRSSSTGNAGSIGIQTSDRLEVSGGEISASSAQGNAGNLDLAARNITLTDNGRLTADTVSGAGGNIQVTARQDLNIANGAEISTSSTGSGNAGKISAAATSLFLNSGGRITSRNSSTGNAGSIGIQVNNLLWISNGEISASSELGGGGRINVTAKNILFNKSSLISSSVFDGTGGGGNISIRAANSFIALQDSDILANARFGEGGTITINSPLFIADVFATVGQNPGSDFSRFRNNGRVDISSSSTFGLSGRINIPDTSFIQNSLSKLEGDFVSPENVVAGSCLARRNTERSSFVVTGTGGLARTPYAQLSGRYQVAPVKAIAPPSTTSQTSPPSPSSQTPPTPHLSWKPGDPIQEAQGFILTPEGRTIIGTSPQLAYIIKAEDLVCDFGSKPK